MISFKDSEPQSRFNTFVLLYLTSVESGCARGDARSLILHVSG
jgi:hypothetical protein